MSTNYNNAATCSIEDTPLKQDQLYMYPLLVTAALPYLAALPILLKPFNWFQRLYLNTILVSTTLGLLWHYLWEPEGYIMFANYYATFCWLLLDVLWAKILNKKYIIIYNFDIIAVHCLIATFTSKNTFAYIMYHSIWHILFTLKSLYVSYLIWKYDKFSNS
jgi:hypothetical protein